MKIKHLFLTVLSAMMATSALAQRHTDSVGRGLVAVKTDAGVFCSWRITAGEYYDVTYNIYRDGTKLNSKPLTVSCWNDEGGSTNSTYAVEPIVRGIAQEKCAAVTTWADGWHDIKLSNVMSRTGEDITEQYEPNDVAMADLDGDGEMELILKRKNTVDANSSYSSNNKTYDIFEAYDMDGTRLWWIDCGPNMVTGGTVELTIMAYDWDMDGKAEVVLRGADDMVIHMADGTTQTIGTAGVNTRSEDGQKFTISGAEFLIYMNGQTGKPYQVLDYPLPRYEAGETNLKKAWGDDYGHRSTKFMFGAPMLDGHKPSIFLARGIYTRHKMVALDVDPATHKLTQRWRWDCNEAGSPWYAQGYHNYGIADVDWDGRDEIVFGSMVIDDNGKGLSTTGYGHGDAQHCSDFDPYRHGQEIFACCENSTSPNNNFRDATTSEVYYAAPSNGDDGRCMMGNFSNDYPGSLGVSAKGEGIISSVTDKVVMPTGGIGQNFRIYWDGDLLSETFNYSGWDGTNYLETGNPRVYKFGTGSIFTFAGSKTCNGSKGTPSFQGDIFGDWREELVLRTDDGNLRIFTTTIPTQHRNYSLWHDHQYRQAMVWQMCAYNQPPHLSYFMGELEGLTVAPPPLTMEGRTEIANGQTIGAAVDDKHIMMCETSDMAVSVADGASPYILTVNAPTWVQGNDDNNNITTTTYTHKLTGGAFAGSMRLVKQGDGTLQLPNVVQKYTGNTEVWGGTLSFDGTLENSRLWMNLHTTLLSDGGVFKKGIEMNYGSEVSPAGDNAVGTITTDSLIMNFGSRARINIIGGEADMLNARVLKIEKKNWYSGPEYLAPVVELVGSISKGVYLIGEVAGVEGNLNDVIIEGVGEEPSKLIVAGGKMYVQVGEDVTESTEYEILYGVATKENGKIVAVNPQYDFTGDEHEATGVAFADGNGENCANAMPIGGSVINVVKNQAWTKDFSKPVTAGKVHYRANYTVSANSNKTFQIVTSDGYAIYSSADNNTGGNATLAVATICGKAIDRYVRQPRDCAYGVKELCIDLDNRILEYHLIVSSGNNSYSEVMGAMYLPEEVTDVKGLKVNKTNWGCMMDSVYLYHVGVKRTYEKQSVSVGSTGYATYCPTQNVDFSGSANIKAYALVPGNSAAVVKLTEVETVPAGEGVLLKSVNGSAATASLPAVESAESIAENMLVGTLVDIDKLASTDGEFNYYILNNGTAGVGFYFANNKKVAAGKAYLKESVENAAKETFFSIEGTTTGIRDNYEVEIMNYDGATYDLMGRKVVKPTKGLYIKNGKKVSFH